MKPPFIPNTQDGLHCVQAAFMMIVKHFEPTFEINWDEWCIITGFEVNKGTWALASLLWLNERGYDVRAVEKFDYPRFAEKGEKYLKEIFPIEDYEYAIKHSNMPLEQSRSKILADTNICVDRAPTLTDIVGGIDEGYLVRAHVNSRKLNGKAGYYGHSVVIYGYDEQGLFFHDPGPEPKPARYENNELMERAMFGDDGLQGEIDLIKMNRNYSLS